MLRFCVATLSLFAIVIASYLSSASAQTYRIEHSWKAQPRSVPGVALEVLEAQHQEEKEKRRIEAARKSSQPQQTTNLQAIHVHVPTSQQGPTWAEYREVVKALQETQLALAKLQAEIANLNARPAPPIVTTKVVPKQNQSRANPTQYLANPKYAQPVSIQLIRDLRGCRLSKGHSP